MPAAIDLPEELRPLARRNALTLDDTRWGGGVQALVETLDRLLSVPAE
jgi:hypothetical protein